MKPILQIIAVSGLSIVGALASQPALTIYNQNFAVVRDTVSLDLKAGTNEVRYSDATAHVEPDSVILRDPTGKRALQILEQNYRNDPVSQELLLSLFEGKTIDFETVSMADPAKRETVRGKIIRSGYTPHYDAMNRYGYQYSQTQMAYAGGGAGQPIIEVNGRLRFSLPGLPLFPGLGDDTVLKPTLKWVIQSAQSGKLDAEVSYITGGFNWEADYNLVAPEKGDRVDLIGWITMDNQSGKTFRDAKIKLLAGDVNKIQPQMLMALGGGMGGGGAGPPPVTEKSFDEYHLYTLTHPTTLLDREMKQVEFLHAADAKAAVLYVYDGVLSSIRFSGGVNTDSNYGTQCNKKVWVMREFMNTEANHLGIALPKGKVRFYRRNDDGQVEFTGEDTIDHTPRNEIVRVMTGNAFDLVGERKQTSFKMSLYGGVNPTTGMPMAVDPATGLPTPGSGPPWIDESFEIKLRNRKPEPVEIRVVEHLYRWSNWDLKEKSDEFVKTDAQAIEFRVPVKPDEEKIITYTVHYSW